MRAVRDYGLAVLGGIVLALMLAATVVWRRPAGRTVPACP